MARILVVSDDGATAVEISTDDEGWTTGRCRVCLALITDRGHFEDTVEQCGIHADQH